MTDPRRDSARERWDIVIAPDKPWYDVDLAGVWHYRDLVVLLFKRDFVSLYKQTVLGPLWYVLQPVLMAVAFTLVFSRIARIPTDGAPAFLFYLAGIVLWNFFSTALGKTSDTFVSNASIFSKVYFPRLVAPLSGALSALLTFAIQFALLLCVLGYYWGEGVRAWLGPQILLVIPLLLYAALVGLGVGIIISSLTTRWRDLSYLVGFAMQLWMYATPVIYPLSTIPERWHWLFMLNPLAACFETFRRVMLGSGTVSAQIWAANLVLAAVLVAAGLLLFTRAERTSMDTI